MIQKYELKFLGKKAISLSLLVCSLLIYTAIVHAQVKVEMSIDSSYHFSRNGLPYEVKGVGGEVHFDYAASIGANSVRTWGVDDADRVLAEAQKQGLSVMLGLWLQHERHGFDYDNAEKVQRQFLHFKNIIDKYKNHPALLCWGIGNELDLQYTNPNCWNAVQQLAKYIHQVDPNHPTTTVTAGLDSIELQEIIHRIPDLDIYCINTYGDIALAVNKVADYGWRGPFMITEWGPNGYWEVNKTKWDVSIEQNSTEKKKVYLERYENYIANNPRCIGSYAFLWGSKQEYTETWFGLYSKDDRPTEPIDALEFVFTGQNPRLPSPTIVEMTLDNKTKNDNIYLASDTYCKAEVNAQISNAIRDTEPDSKGELSYSWKVLYESTDKKSGGDVEESANEANVKIKNSKTNSIQFRTPTQTGAYRLFVTVSLGNKEAYANIPFYVNESNEKNQSRLIQLKTASMEDFE